MSSDEDFPALPDWKDLDFSNNCTIWGNWLATWLLPDPWNPTEPTYGGSIATLRLYQSAVSPELLGSYLQPNVSYLDGSTPFDPRLYSKVLEWWTFNMYDSFYIDDSGEQLTKEDAPWVANVVHLPQAKCPDELCRAMGFTGNPDIIGIGVQISYIVEAVLATIYLFAFTASRLRNSSIFRSKKTIRRSTSGSDMKKGPLGIKLHLPLHQRIMDSFRGSLEGFFAASMLMSMAVIAASIWISSEGNKERGNPIAEKVLPYADNSIYNMVLSVLASIFSVFPVIILYPLLSAHQKNSRGEVKKTSHRVWLRRASMFILWVLITVEVFLSPRGNDDYDDRHNPNQEANTNPCNKRGGTDYWEGMNAAQWLIIGVPLLWMIITTFLVTGFKVPGLAQTRIVRWIRSVWGLVVAWLCLVIAWILLRYFTFLRLQIIISAGEADEDNEWGFGQALALATWFPVILEFIYIFIWGLEDSLNTRLPAGFEVKVNGSENEYTRTDTLASEPYQGYGNLPKTEPQRVTERVPII